MSLPASRNKTYSPGDPVDSAILNALQDQIVGAKSPAITIPIHPTAFRTVSGGIAWDVSGDLMSWDGTGVSLTARTSLWLPVGMRLVSVEWFYDRHSAGTIGLGVDETDMTAGGGHSGVDGFSDVTSLNGVISSGIRTINHVVVTKKALIFSALLTNTASKFAGLQVVIDRL